MGLDSKNRCRGKLRSKMAILGNVARELRRRRAACTRLPTKRESADALHFAQDPPTKKGAPCGAPFSPAASPRPWEEPNLRRIVHHILDRMRGVLEADHLGHLQLDVAVDEVVVEHAAGLEELAVLVEVHQRLAQ